MAGRSARLAAERLAPCLVIVLVALTAGGCWGARDIEMRTFVLMIGVDSTEDGVRVSAQVAVNERMGGGERGGGGEDAFRVIQHDSASVAEAINLLQDASPHQLYYGHLKVVVFGEDYAKERGTGEAIDTLIREPEVRGQVLVVGTSGKAEDLIRAGVKGESLPASFIERLLMTGHHFGHAPRAQLLGLAACLDTVGCHPVIPLLRAEEGLVEVGGALVFRGDRAIGRLEHKELHNLSLITGARMVGVYSIPSPRGQGRLYVILRRPRQVIEVRTDGGGATIDVTIFAEGEVVEDSGHAGLYQPASREMLGTAVSQLNQAISGEIERQVGGLIERVRTQYGVDIFGFVRHSGRLKLEDGKWDQLFPAAKVNVKAKIRLRRFGLGGA